MTSQQLKKAERDALAQADAICTQAESEGRELTAEEQAAFDEHEKAAKAYKDAAAEAQATEAARAAVRARLNELTQGTGRRTAPDTPTQPGARIAQVHEAWLDDPNRGYPTPRAFILDVLKAGMGRGESEQLRSLKIEAAAGSDEQGTYSDIYGGYAIPEGLSPNMLQVAAEADPISGRTTNVPMSTPIVRVNARTDKTHTSSVSGGLRVYRRAEADTVSASRMAMEQVVLNATSLMGIAYATEELLTDSPVSFAALLAAGFRDEFQAVMIDERLNGSGAGQCEGVISVCPATVSVAKEANQTADSICHENIVKMRARAWGYANAIWLANHDCLPELATMAISVGTGGAPIYHLSDREDVPDTLMGRPIFYTEYCKTIGDRGDIIICNWSQYLDGLYEPLQGASSIHVRFENHEQAFKFWLRNDGRCWWRTALTPKNSTSTLSPFVTLDERA